MTYLCTPDGQVIHVHEWETMEGTGKGILRALCDFEWVVVTDDEGEPMVRHEVVERDENGIPVQIATSYPE